MDPGGDCQGTGSDIAGRSRRNGLSLIVLPLHQSTVPRIRRSMTIRLRSRSTRPLARGRRLKARAESRRALHQPGRWAEDFGRAAPAMDQKARVHQKSKLHAV